MPLVSKSLLAKLVCCGGHSHQNRALAPPGPRPTHLNTIRSVSAPPLSSTSPEVIIPRGHNSGNDAGPSSSDVTTGVVSSTETGFAPGADVDTHESDDHPIDSIEVDDHDINTYRPQLNDNIPLQGGIFTASIRGFHYLTEGFTPRQGSSPTASPGIDDDVRSSDLSEDGISDDYVSDEMSDDDETIRGDSVSTTLPDSLNNNATGQPSADMVFDIDPEPINNLLSNILMSTDDLALQEWTRMPSLTDQYNLQGPSSLLPGLSSSVNAVQGSSVVLPLSTNGFPFQAYSSSVNAVQGSSSGLPLSTDGFPFQGPSRSYHSAEDYSLMNADTLVEGSAAVQTRRPRPTQPQRSMLLDDGKSRTAGMVSPTIQKYGSYGVPTFRGLTGPFTSPMDELDDQIRVYPDLGHPFWISTVAMYLDDLYSQLAKFQHPDFPYYVNGYFWMYEMCFIMINKLAEHIEQHRLRLRKYIEELIMQINTVYSRLVVEDAPQVLVDMAVASVDRLRAI